MGPRPARDDGGEPRRQAVAGLVGTLRDLEAFAFELLAPRLLAPASLAAATSVAFPGLRGVLPGFGLQDPLDWSLGFELRAAKSPHWMGARNSPRTFGQFGGSGTFLWVDPDAGIGLVALTDRQFGQWATTAWPAFADAVLLRGHGLSRERLPAPGCPARP